MKCRFCNNELKTSFVDLGKSPMANSYLKDKNKMEPFYPLKTYVCSNCFLVQLEEFENPKQIFSDYAYFSSYSTTWVEHIREYVDEVIKKMKIDEKKQVIEIASNDGYLLQFFKKNNIPILGIEPASNIAKIANEKGIKTINEFFGEETAKKLAEEGQKADLLIGFNVLPHVPNLNDFMKGLKILLSDKGIITIQFSAYLLQLIQQNEFDVIYHEHFSYFSLFTLQKIFTKYNMTIFDVQEIPIHGGSLRIFIKHENNINFEISDNVEKQISKEIKFGIAEISKYPQFQKQTEQVKQNILELLIKIKKEGKSIAGYGAPAKGNTLLNYCGIGTDFIEYTVDKNPHKQNLYLPGTNIPVYPIDIIFEKKPDYVLILAWNFKEEIMEQMKQIRAWGAKFIVLIPEVVIL
ncbi:MULTISPECIES: class I SAM-dependent methyltransferase [Nitrosopumilus]|nr:MULTISPECIES: class I SAM-dependent methyltransferase [Nitrosopumilus]